MWLENEHIKLRALEPDDLDILFAWENNSELWTYGSTLAPYSRLSLRQYLIDAQQQDIYQSRQLRLMVESREPHKKILGTVDLYEYDPFNNRAGVGILIDADSRHMGYGLQTLHLLEKYAFEYLGIHQLYAYVSVHNQKSFGLFKKAGYQLVATLADWNRQKYSYHDVYLLQLINHGESE